MRHFLFFISPFDQPMNTITANDVQESNETLTQIRNILSGLNETQKEMQTCINGIEEDVSKVLQSTVDEKRARCKSGRIQAYRPRELRDPKATRKSWTDLLGLIYEHQHGKAAPPHAIESIADAIKRLYYANLEVFLLGVPELDLRFDTWGKIKKHVAVAAELPMIVHRVTRGIYHGLNLDLIGYPVLIEVMGAAHVRDRRNNDPFAVKKKRHAGAKVIFFFLLKWYSSY